MLWLLWSGIHGHSEAFRRFRNSQFKMSLNCEKLDMCYIKTKRTIKAFIPFSSNETCYHEQRRVLLDFNVNVIDI